MKKKILLLGILIICLLTATFLWSGNSNKVSTKNENSNKVEAASSIVVSQNTENNQDKENTAKNSKNQDKDIENKVSQEVYTDTDVISGKLPKSDEKSKALASTEKNIQPTKTEKLEKNESKSDTLNAKGKKDKFLTDPVPKGKPKPVEWQNVAINKDKELTCTLSVICKTILDNMDDFNKDKLEVLPEDGIIYKAQKVCFNQGESVFDVLLSEMKKNKIHMEFEMTPIYNSNYIEGINNLYEFDCGELSGWMYKVNDWFPNYGCSRYVLKDGDIVEWIYTCDLGRDIGGGMATGGKE